MPKHITSFNTEQHHVGIGYIAYINSPLGIIARGNPNAGLWEDDSKNWNRAFHGDPPRVSLWFTQNTGSQTISRTSIYFFEVKAPPEWQESFLLKGMHRERA